MKFKHATMVPYCTVQYSTSRVQLYNCSQYSYQARWSKVDTVQYCTVSYQRVKLKPAAASNLLEGYGRERP